MSHFQALDHNVDLSVEETLPDLRYAPHLNVEDQRRLIHHEVQVTPSVLRFPDAVSICLTRCLCAICRVFGYGCCNRSVEETEPCFAQTWILNGDDGEMILLCIQQPS